MTASLSFLSDAWFSASRDALGACRAPEDVPDVAVQFRSPASGVEWVEVVAAGGVEQWRAGQHPNPDLVVEMDEHTLWGAATGQLDGAAVLGAVTLPGGGPVSPMDLGAAAAAGSLPAIAGADLAVQYDYRDGPWGDVPYSLVFADGQIASMGLRRLDDPDATAVCTYRQMAQVRRGDIGILDVLAAGGTVTGSEGPLALLGGFSESPEFRSMELACGPSGHVLGVLGSVHGSVGFASALAEVMADTASPGAGS